MKVELEAFFCYLKTHIELQMTLLIYHFTPLASQSHDGQFFLKDSSLAIITHNVA